MHPTLINLLRLLTLSPGEDDNTWAGESEPFGGGRVYGGLVLGQALAAAQRSVPADRGVHSLHGYFLRPGRGDLPIVHTVDRIRDGRSFTTRRVVSQQGGEAIFNLSVSFQIGEGGFAHDPPTPDAPGPDTLLSMTDLAKSVAHRFPPGLRERMTREWPVEARPVVPYNPMEPDVRPPVRQVWIRAVDRLPDDPLLHRALLVYASDSHFLTTSLQPHGVSWMTPGVQVASLDHSMWFHHPFRADEWLLYDVVSPWAGGARGLVQGRFFDTSGRLVASTTQEGLIRDRRPEGQAG